MCFYDIVLILQNVLSIVAYGQILATYLFLIVQNSGGGNFGEFG